MRSINSFAAPGGGFTVLGAVCEQSCLTVLNEMIGLPATTPIATLRLGIGDSVITLFEELGTDVNVPMAGDKISDATKTVLVSCFTRSLYETIHTLRRPDSANGKLVAFLSTYSKRADCAVLNEQGRLARSLFNSEHTGGLLYWELPSLQETKHYVSCFSTSADVLIHPGNRKSVHTKAINREYAALSTDEIDSTFEYTDEFDDGTDHPRRQSQCQIV